MFKVNDKGTGTRFYIFVNRFYIIVNFEHITYFIFSVSIVDCEQVNVRRGILYNKFSDTNLQYRGVFRIQPNI